MERVALAARQDFWQAVRNVGDRFADYVRAQIALGDGTTKEFPEE